MSNKKETEVAEVPNKIWEDIKDLELPLYGLPGQLLVNHATRFDLGDDNSVYLKLKSTAVLAAIEEAMAGKKLPYEVEQTTNYTIIRKADKPL